MGAEPKAKAEDFRFVSDLDELQVGEKPNAFGTKAVEAMPSTEAAA